jgi:hypothetical protein
VLVAGAVIFVTAWTPADPIASVLIALLILPRTWHLLREAIDVLLQATPKGIDLDEVRAHLLRGEGIVDAHDLHAWTLTSGMHVVSAHVVIEPTADAAEVLDEVCRCRLRHGALDHSARNDRPAAPEGDVASLICVGPTHDSCRQTPAPTARPSLAQLANAGGLPQPHSGFAGPHRGRGAAILVKAE